MSTTTSAFPVKPLQRPTPPKIGAKKGAYDGGYNKGLWTTRVTFQKGDLNPLPRMSQEPQRGFLSETREQQLLAADMRRQSATRELPKIDLDPLSTARRLLSASTKTDLKTAPARPEAPKTGYAQNWSGNGSILGGSTVPLPSSRYTPLDTLTETADKYIPPVTVKRGGSGSANDSAFSLTNTWVGSAATPVKTGNSAYSPREVRDRSSLARSLCATAHPRRTRFAKRLGTSLRLNRRRAHTLGGQRLAHGVGLPARREGQRAGPHLSCLRDPALRNRDQRRRSVALTEPAL